MKQKEPAQGLGLAFSSTWAADGLQSLNFSLSLGTLGTCRFSQVLKCLRVDNGPFLERGSMAPTVVFGQPGELRLLSRKPGDSSLCVSDLSSLFSLS